jgi:peptidoglycan/LPS O-acetylase OafA/YrhL
MVVFSHEYAIVPGLGSEPLAQLSGGFATFGTLGVDIFFVISGLLVTRSLVDRSAIGFFVASRALRILPALAVVLALSAWVIGPILTDLPLREYLAAGRVWSYVVRNLTLADSQWGLPGVFARNPVGDAVNGSLWTLQPEVLMYGLLLLLGAIAAAGGTRLSRFRGILVGAGMVAAITWGWATHATCQGAGWSRRRWHGSRHTSAWARSFTWCGASYQSPCCCPPSPGSSRLGPEEPRCSHLRSQWRLR